MTTTTPLERTAPLISVILPTANRPHFLAQAVRLFLAQDYPRKELIIVDSSSAPSYSYREIAHNVFYLWLSEDLYTGTKRNLACALARGEIIALQDDDDYYGPGRLSRQGAPLLAGEADVSAFMLDRLLLFPGGEAWRLTDPALRRHLFGRDASSGTLMFRRSWWGADAGTTYQDHDRSEDALFLLALLARGARLATLEGRDDYVYVRHGSNRWQWTSEMRPAAGPHWERLSLDQVVSPESLPFYQALASPRGTATPAANAGGQESLSSSLSRPEPTHLPPPSHVQFTQDWFSHNIPALADALGPYAGRDGVRALEIGCFEGRSTRWFLSQVLTGAGARLHVIDTFAGGADHAHLDTSRLLSTFLANVVADFPEQVVIHRGCSQDLLPAFAGAQLDFVYVDGSHAAADVLSDAVLSWQALRDGGLLIFDDYAWQGLWPKVVPESERPKAALDAFLTVFAGRYELLHQDYLLIARKRAPGVAPVEGAGAAEERTGRAHVHH